MAIHLGIRPNPRRYYGSGQRPVYRGAELVYGKAVFPGRLLIADITGDELYEIDPDGADSQGTLLRDLPSGLTSPQA